MGAAVCAVYYKKSGAVLYLPAGGDGIVSEFVSVYTNGEWRIVVMADIYECREGVMSRKLNYTGAIGLLFPYIKKHKKNFWMFYFGWLFDLMLAVVMPILFGIMIDEIVYRQNVSLFLKLSGMYVVMAVFSCLLYFFIYAQHHYLMNMYTLDIRLDIFRHLMKCDAQHLTDISTGDVIELLQQDSEECMHFIIRNVIHQFNRILSICLILFYLCRIDWRIGLFSMISAPVCVFINAKFGKRIRGYGDEQRSFYGSYISWVYEILSALRDIRILSAQKHVQTRFEEYHQKLFAVERKSGMASLTAQKLIEFSNLAVCLAIYTFSGYLASKGEITIGLLTVVLSFYKQLMDKISEVGPAHLDAQNRIACIQKIYDFMNTPTEDANGGRKELVVTEGNIWMNQVTFSYQNGTEILQDFNLRIRAGERLALTGKSGRGKTTMAYLLLGFYQPEKGDIWIDGQRLSDCSLQSIRSQIGLVAQDVLLFPGTIRENICLGNPKASRKQIEEACTQAGLCEVLQALPNGLDTVVGMQGSDLSGGQKQRIAIARIYLKDPKILIFDEATSALDAETEREIHEAWDKALKGRTSIVISHRPSSVMYCDRKAIL